MKKLTIPEYILLRDSLTEKSRQYSSWIAEKEKNTGVACIRERLEIAEIFNSCHLKLITYKRKR